MRRKAGGITHIERTILEAVIQLKAEGFEQCHGFQIAQKIKDLRGARLLVGYGTLYRALGRLRQQGLLEAKWEEQSPDERNGPRRRYYHITSAGVAMLSSLAREPEPNILGWEVT